MATGDPLTKVACAVAVVGLAISFVLMVVYFNPWFAFIEVVNAGLIVGLVWLDLADRVDGRRLSQHDRRL